MRRSIGAIVLLFALAPASAGAGRVWTIDFNGCLPPEATLTRASPRLDADGVEHPPDTPRFTTSAIASAATRLVRLPDTDRMMAVGRVDGEEIAVIQRGLLELGLSSPTFGLDTEEVTWAHPDALARFGYAGSEWGCPKVAEIYPDGTILIHTAGAGPDRRNATILTSVDGFTRADGFELRRLSCYAPPPGLKATVAVDGFTRLSYLPNLGVWVSTVAEYQNPRVASSVDPLDGRALGWASTDGGRTWTRVIDTDDPCLGRGFFESHKHLHHVEPFEWWDEASSRWNIGAAGCLGDAEGRSGVIWVTSPDPTFPPEGANCLMSASRTNGTMDRGLVDLFPLDPSDSPGSPMRFLIGQDGELAGVFDATVSAGVETNRALWRPVIPSMPRGMSGHAIMLPRSPYLFQYQRLGHGAVVGAANENWPYSNPNGLWISDPTCEHWTMAALTDDRGFFALRPVGEDRFWTRFISEDGQASGQWWELWEVEAPVVRPGLMLGAGVREVRDLDLFTPGVHLDVTDVTGRVAPPAELRDDTRVLHVFSDDHPADAHVACVPLEPVSATPGDLVSIRYWIRPAAPDRCACRLEQHVRIARGGGGGLCGDSLNIQTESTEWIPVYFYLRWPDGPFEALTARVTIMEDATPEEPIAYYVTQPRIVVADQANHQPINAAGPTAPDRLEVALPELGEAWTIAVRVTEAPTLALALIDEAGDALSLLPAPGPEGPIYNGIDVALELCTTSGGATTTVDASHPYDVYMPAPCLVVFRKPAGAAEVEVWLSRGSAELETLAAPSAISAPTTLRFGSPDGSVAFEGLAHRVTAWTHEALDPTRIEGLRTFFDPDGPAGCPGDLAPDGVVDIADFSVMAASFGTVVGACPRDGDLDGDGDVDVFDFARFASAFGCGQD